MKFISKNKKHGFVIVKQSNPSELRFDEKTGTVRIIRNREVSEGRTVAATPVIMPRKVRRDIRRARGVI